MKLYAIRHGRTDWNVRKLMQGRTDISLNREGIEQARQTKEALKDYSFDRIFVSPLKRAMQTAEIVTAGLDLPLLPAEPLRERSYGVYEGCGKETFDYYGFWDYDLNLCYEDAECIRDFFKRVWDFLDLLKERFPEERILLITHSGVIRAIECYADPSKINDKLGYWLPKNCSVHEYTL